MLTPPTSLDQVRDARPKSRRHSRSHRLPHRAAAPLRRLLGTAPAVVAAGLAGASAATNRAAQRLLRPTRELYREFNEAFNAHWQAEGHGGAHDQASHGGSGAQARAVIDGLEAQVVTLALASDIDAIAGKSDKIPGDWQRHCRTTPRPTRRPSCSWCARATRRRSRTGTTWSRDGVQVITPNPKTSGGALELPRRLGLGRREFGATKTPIRKFMHELFAHVPVLDTGARGATTTFAQRGLGDVLLAWENEACLAQKELGADQFESSIRGSRSWPSRRWRWSKATSLRGAARGRPGLARVPRQPRGPASR